MAEAPFDEREFQRWVVTSPWFQDLAKSLQLDSDELKALLARQIFNDSNYDFRGMYQANLSPTVANGRLSLPKSSVDGASFLSPSQQIEDFFTTQLGVPSKFFGTTGSDAVRVASALGFLPGYAVPDLSVDNEPESRLAASLSAYSAEAPATPDIAGLAESAKNLDLTPDIRGILGDSGLFSRQNIKEAIGSGIGSTLAGGISRFAGPIGGGIGAALAGAGKGEVTGQIAGGLIGLPLGPLGSALGGFLGGLLGSRFDENGDRIQADIRGTTTGTVSGGGSGIDAAGRAVSGSSFGTIGPAGITSYSSTSGGGIAPVRSAAFYERTGVDLPASLRGDGAASDNERGAANTGSVSDIRGRDAYGDEVAAV